MIRIARAAITTLALTGIASCGRDSPSIENNVAVAGQTQDVATIAERYVTASDEAMNIDSLATYTASDGNTWLLATAKAGDLLRVYDASTGKKLRDVGHSGAGAGEFRRPNGIFAIDDFLLVVERDNHRVQALSLPALESLGSFGEDILLKPYGLFVEKLGANDSGERRYRLFVTDAYETADEQVPPDDELGRRVQTWTLVARRNAENAVTAVEPTYERAFGETSGPGTLRVVESIWADSANDRLMIAEEDPAGGRVLKLYDMQGRFSGQRIGEGIFRFQPEGIALYACADGSGYWIATDQDRDVNVFHLFDRRTLAHVGAFSGEITRNTDGVWLHQRPLKDFPAGAFFAVHDDQAAAAFDWRDIAQALDLKLECASEATRADMSARR